MKKGDEYIFIDDATESSCSSDSEVAQVLPQSQRKDSDSQDSFWDTTPSDVTSSCGDSEHSYTSQQLNKMWEKEGKALDPRQLKNLLSELSHKKNI